MRNVTIIGILCLLMLPVVHATAQADAVAIQVFDGCNAGDEIQRIVHGLQRNGFRAAAAGRVREAQETSLLLTPDQASVGRTIVPHLPEQARVLRVRENPPGAVRLIVGCDVARRVPAAPTRQAGIIVLNGCRDAALGEAVARTLILAGFNVTRVSMTSEQTTPGKSEIHALTIHRNTADRLQRVLRGEQSVETWDELPEGIEVQLVVGCEQEID